MNNQKTFMIVLTSIVLLIAGYGIYVEKNIKASATTILVDRLEPVPLISHRFDYSEVITCETNWRQWRKNFGFWGHWCQLSRHD